VYCGLVLRVKRDGDGLPAGRLLPDGLDKLDSMRARHVRKLDVCRRLLKLYVYGLLPWARLGSGNELSVRARLLLQPLCAQHNAVVVRRGVLLPRGLCGTLAVPSRPLWECHQFVSFGVRRTVPRRLRVPQRLRRAERVQRGHVRGGRRGRVSAL